jgi:hypothetical protein
MSKGTHFVKGETIMSETKVFRRVKIIAKRKAISIHELDQQCSIDIITNKTTEEINQLLQTHKDLIDCHGLQYMRSILEAPDEEIIFMM